MNGLESVSSMLSLTNSVPANVKEKFQPYITSFIEMFVGSNNSKTKIKEKTVTLIKFLEEYLNSIDAETEGIEYARNILLSLDYITEPNPSVVSDGSVVTSMFQKFLKSDEIGKTILTCESSDENNNITNGNRLDFVLPRILACCDVKEGETIDSQKAEPCKVFYTMPPATSTTALKTLLGILIYTEFDAIQYVAPNAFQALNGVVSALTQNTGTKNLSLSTVFDAFKNNPSLFEIDIPQEEIELLPNEVTKITVWLTVIGKNNNMSTEYIERLKEIVQMALDLATNKAGNADPLPILMKMAGLMSVSTTNVPS